MTLHLERRCLVDSGSPEAVLVAFLLRAILSVLLPRTAPRFSRNSPTALTPLQSLILIDSIRRLAHADLDMCGTAGRQHCNPTYSPNFHATRTDFEVLGNGLCSDEGSLASSAANAMALFFFYGINVQTATQNQVHARRRIYHVCESISRVRCTNRRGLKEAARPKPFHADLRWLVILLSRRRARNFEPRILFYNSVLDAASVDPGE
ncbi:hypothetical protein DFH09DRAFT_1095617 [Mycena vulgaris]|nr:hypothetical protein DFH09DRAFT_1095617 [Mycena vulgaris]